MWAFLAATGPVPWISAMEPVNVGSGVAVQPVHATGAGGVAVKSVPFWSVSVPEASRLAEVELVRAGAAFVPSRVTAVP